MDVGVAMRQKSQIPSQRRRLLILVIEKGVSAVEREEGAKLFALTGQ